MRAITYNEFGAANDVLAVSDLSIPTAAKGEVLVRLHTSGVNPSDTKARAGGRPGVFKPPFPMIVPHSDGAGIIENVGEGVSKTRIGERVWVWNGQWQRAFGTAAEYIALPSQQAVTLPHHTSFETGAVLGIPGLTAVHAVLSHGSVAGKTVLVSGGAGTVGHLAIQTAKASGANVIATAGDQDGIDAAKSAGAAHVFHYADTDLADKIIAANNGNLIDHIVEVEFGNNVETNAQVITENGTMSAFGSAKTMMPELPFYPLMFKAITLEFVLVYLLTPQQRSKAINDLTNLLNQNALNIRIANVLDLSDCAKAHDIVTQGNRAGSVVLTI